MFKTVCLILSMFSNTEECKNQLQVPKYKTVVQEHSLKHNLYLSHFRVFNKPANANRVSMAWAQIAFENGRGNHIYNYNLGNIGLAKTADPRPYYKVAGSKFISFPSLEEGAAAYWNTLKDMCPGALKYFDSGDAPGAAIALKRCNYYRAELNFYSKNLGYLFNEQIIKNNP